MIKAALRAELRRERRALHEQNVGAANHLVRVFQASGLELPVVAALYRPAGFEIDPTPLAEWLGAKGVQIVMPVVVARDAPLIFRQAVEGIQAHDALGLPVPPPHAPEFRPDVVFTPLLGFDRLGGRIGQGGGYYDRTLAALRRAGPAVRAIGIAYAGQEVERVPLEPCDEALDGVLTEKAYLPFA